MTLEQWEKLSAFIKSEAKYAALDMMNKASISDTRLRYEYEDEARSALIKELHND